MHRHPARASGLRGVLVFTACSVACSVTCSVAGSVAGSVDGPLTDSAASVTTQGPATLTWGDVAAAIDRHPLYRAALSTVAAADGEAAEARAYPNPEVGLGLGSGQALEGAESRRVWEVEVTLPLLSPLARRGGAQAAAAERTAVAWEARARRQEAFAQLRGLFLSLAHGQERLRVLAQSQQQVAHLAEVARLRVRHGEARPLEAQQFEIELARIEIEQDAATLHHAAGLETLSAWLGGGLPPEVRLEADLADPPQVPALAEALTVARERQPELQAAASRVRSAGHRLAAERWARWPDVSASGFYERELDAESRGARLALAVPLWNWNGGAVARARAQQEEARWLRELTERQLEAEVREAHAETSAALARERRYRLEILPKAAAAAAALEQMYQVGEADVLETLAAEREATEIAAQLWDARLELQLAALRLSTLMGGFADDDNAQRQ